MGTDTHVLFNTYLLNLLPPEQIFGYEAGILT